MAEVRLTFAGEFGGLAALGLADPELLFEPDARLSERYEELERDQGRTRARFPLPGTPDVHGRLTGAVLGLGTGWVRLTTWRDPAWGRVLRARWSHPRSASLAEREWNLLCHLRAHGVGTSEPLLVGARGAGPVARRSFLVVRELEGALPFERWLRGYGGEAEERARGLRSLALTLANLRRSGVVLARLSPAQVWLTPAGGECEHEAPGSPRKNRLPGVALSDVEEGLLAPVPPHEPAWLESFLAELERALAPAERAELRARAAAELDPSRP